MKNIRKKLSRKEKGFTIIEVVLVLAIAGLIFAMVFIALPALQRSQRNTERRRNLSLIKAAFEQWKVHNSVAITDSYSSRYAKNGFCTFYAKYLTDLRDPNTGEPYKVALWGSTRVTDCTTKQDYDRGRYDPEVHGTIGGETDNWAMMEIGDIQFDDTAFCNEEGGFDDDVSGKLGHQVTSGTNLYAIRMRLEGGEAVCVDGTY